MEKQENLSGRNLTLPIFRMTLIFKPDFVDQKFLHTRAVYECAASAQAILLINTFRPALRDFIVSFIDGNGEKQKYNPGQWDDYIFRMQLVVGANQGNLFSNK